MDVVVVGKHTEVDAALRELTKEKLSRLSKFANDVRRIDVDYCEEPTKRASDSHSCEILVHVNHHLVKGTASAAEHPAALEKALDKVEHQMRKLHEKRVTSRTGTRARNAGSDNGVALPPDEGEESEKPIVKVKQFDLKPMTVDEAALQMELLGHDFFVFRVSDNGKAGVLYKRKDGALGLIEVAG